MVLLRGGFWRLGSESARAQHAGCRGRVVYVCVPQHTDELLPGHSLGNLASCWDGGGPQCVRLFMISELSIRDRRLNAGAPGTR